MPRTRQGTPFPFEGPVPTELLIDRLDELEVLARRAGDRVNVRLVAPRRYGKTSVLLAHAERLRETGWRTAHVDFSRVADMTDVARRLASAYATLDTRWVQAHLAGLLTRLGVTLSLKGPVVTVTPRPRDADASAIAHPVPRRRRGDVYAGSEPSMMRELFDVRERPLLGQADPLTIGPLPLDATIDELTARFVGEQLDAGEALGQLTTFAAGHPQRTMLLAHLLAVLEPSRGTTLHFCRCRRPVEMVLPRLVVRDDGRLDHAGRMNAVRSRAHHRRNQVCPRARETSGQTTGRPLCRRRRASRR